MDFLDMEDKYVFKFEIFIINTLLIMFDHFLLYYIFEYLPFVYYLKLSIINKNCYQKFIKESKKYKKTHLYHSNKAYANAFHINYINIDRYSKNRFHMNMISCLKVYQNLTFFEKIFYQNTTEKTNIAKYYRFTKKYSYILSDIIRIGNNTNSFIVPPTFQIKFTDKNDKKINFRNWVNITEKNNLLEKIYFISINEERFTIIGWIKHLLEIKSPYLRLACILKYLKYVLYEYITKYIFTEDIKKINVNPNNTYKFRKPKYIYCSGFTINNKRCKNKIKYNNNIRWYCSHHQPIHQHIILPSIITGKFNVGFD